MTIQLQETTRRLRGDYVMTVKIENAGGMNIVYMSCVRQP
jgi:hypothetical protein